MEDFKILRVLDKFKGLISKIGVDYEIMRKILQIKLTMDSRRTFTIFNNGRNKDKEGNQFFKSLWIYALFGIVIIFMVISKNMIFTQMSIAFGMIMFMVTASLISDFSSILLDIRDKNILFTRPVSSKTISMAKFIHIFIYMFYITIALTGPALVVSLFTQGFLFFIIFFFEIVLVDLFIIVFTALLYILILRFFDGEKLKDVINYVQIILSLVITIGYQFIGRVFNIVDMKAVFTPKWWHYFIMPVWFGAPFEVFINGSRNITCIIMSLLALAVPIIAMSIYIKLIPSFERNLQKLMNVEKGVYKKSIAQFLSKVLCAKKEERTFFKFTWNMLKNEREFKLKVYPSLGFAIIMPFIFLLMGIRGNQSLMQWFNQISTTRYYLNIYLCALMLPTIVIMIKYSGKYKGAWIYKIMPQKGLDCIFKGAIKAFIVKLMLPIYIFDSIIFMFIFGIGIFPHLIIIFLNIILFTIICFKSTKKALPFSESFEVAQQSEGLIVILLMIILGVLWAVHYYCTKSIIYILIYFIVLAALDVILWNKAFKLKWEDIHNS